MIRVAVRIASSKLAHPCRSERGSVQIVPTTDYAYGGLL